MGLSVMHLRITISCALLAAVSIGSAGDARAIDCQSEKGAGYPWAWRLIDGQRCWYKGNPGMDKKLLQWAATNTAPSAAPRRSPSVKIDAIAKRDPLLNSYWPPLPQADDFGARFGAARGERP